MEDYDYDYPTVKAVIKLQSAYRGFLYRKRVSRLDQENAAAIKIQKVWKEHLNRQKMNKIIVFIAYRRIKKVVHNYLVRKKLKKQLKDIAQFDPILSFYPSQSLNMVTEEKSNLSKKKQLPTIIAPKDNVSSKMREKFSHQSSSRFQPKIVTVKSSKSHGSHKRKILVEMLPPWHALDERKIGPSQKDDMLYEQKNTVAWVKAELLPLFMTRCKISLNKCDELKNKNERFEKRSVYKPIIYCLQRSSKPSFFKSAVQIQVFNGMSSYMVISHQKCTLYQIESLIMDQIVYHASFQINVPLFDSVVNPFSSQVIGIDQNWNLLVFEKGVVVVSRPLNVSITIPKSPHFLFFDAFGMLWVNLLTQNGHLYCMDPLTLEPTIQISHDPLFSRYFYFTKLIKLEPISLNNKPLGFMGTFKITNDLYLFTGDFSREKILPHPKMTSTVRAKQCGNRIIAWSNDRVLYIYDLKEYISTITLNDTITVNSNPVDVCSTDSPSLIYVACEDSTLHIYLGTDVTLPLRIPDNKMTAEEAASATKLLGPMKYTKSGKIFSEFRVGKFISTPTLISVIPYTENLAIVIGVFENGAVGTMLIVNEPKSVHANEFDKLEYFNTQTAQTFAFNEFKKVANEVARKRTKFKESTMNIIYFNSKAIRGQVRKLFFPGAEPFSLVDLIFHTKSWELFPFLPKVGEDRVTIYELFHYLKRAGVLPEALDTFVSFLKNFDAGRSIRDSDASFNLYNMKLPVETTGVYNAISDISFEKSEVEAFLNKINPLNCLNFSLKDFTVAQANAGISSISTARIWLSLKEKAELSKRIQKLTKLEDLVKHELMKRVQDNINKTFYSTLLDKIIPVAPIDLRLVQKESESEIQFTPHPHRNPLLNDALHKTFYDDLSQYTLYGKDRKTNQILHALHIPNKDFIDNDLSGHLAKIQQFSFASKKITNCIHSIVELSHETRVVVTEDKRGMPLSYFLNVHSFLGSDPKLLLIGRTILCRSLEILYTFHQKQVILRSFCPENIILNATDSQVMLASIFDAQFPSVNTLPLSEEFSDYKNPFLPPEYFHCDPSEYTTAFDIWQFGMMLLYMLTGLLPKGYGEELIGNLPPDQRTKYINMKPNERPKIPKITFFYDWLKDTKLVHPGERKIGERGECFIMTDDFSEQPSILDIDKYTLLPYKNTKLNFDEEKLFLHIISSCLQIDPKARPTTESLLMTYCFNMPSKASDTLDMYFHVLKPDIFTSQFIYPLFQNFGSKSFDFTIGVLQALLFQKEEDEDDDEYGFPIDTSSNSRVVRTIFSMKFVDKIVEFVLNRMANKITVNDVMPTITFHDEIFDKVLQFFTRFVSSIEAGRGPLCPYVDDCVYGLISLYTANPYIRYTSSQINSDPESFGFLTSQDSTYVFIFTHSTVHPLLRYVLSSSTFIAATLERSKEHNDSYFSQFLTFSEGVYNLCHALCYTIEKQKANAIKTLNGLWNNNGQIARLFVDFKVTLKVSQCLHLQNARIEAETFLLNCMQVIKSKMHDPTYRILYKMIITPISMLHTGQMVKPGVKNDNIRQTALDFISSTFHDQQSGQVVSYTNIETIWYLFDTIREPQISLTVNDIIDSSNLVLMDALIASKHIMKIVQNNDMKIAKFIDMHAVDNLLEVPESLDVGKQLTIFFYLYKKMKGEIDYETFLDKMECSVKYFKKALYVIKKESESVTKFIDTQALRATRFDLKETKYLKAKNKLKELNITEIQSDIYELCYVLLKLYKCVVYFWRSKVSTINKDLLNFIIKVASTPIPYFSSQTHPLSRVILVFTEMIEFSFREYPNTPVTSYYVSEIGRILQIYHKDYLYLESAEKKHFVDVQSIELYYKQRELRISLFRSIIKHALSPCYEPFFNYIVDSMIPSSLVIHSTVMQFLQEKIKFPLKSEAYEMIKIVISHYEENREAHNLLMDKLCTEKFIECQRKLLRFDENLLLIRPSIELMELIVNYNFNIDKVFRNNLKSLITSMKQQYIRPCNMDLVNKEIKEIPIIRAVSSSQESINYRKRVSYTSHAKRQKIGTRIINARMRPVTAIQKRSYGARK